MEPPVPELVASMSKKRPTGTLPQPPWSYSPSEVAQWMASTAGPRPPRDPRSRRQVRVKSFSGRCPSSAEDPLFRRLNRLGFQRIEGAMRSPPGRQGLAHSREWNAFLGKLGETQVHIRLRKGATLEFRVTFTPRASFRRASKLISRLDVRGLEGTWT